MRLQFRQCSAYGTDYDVWENAKTRVSADYNRLISELSLGQESPDWWVSSIASRNPFVSRLYFRLCVLEYISQIASSGALKGLQIDLDSHALSSMLKTLLANKGASDYSVSVHIRPKESKFLRVLKVVFTHFAQLYLLKKPSTKIAQIESTTLIDLFILPGWRSGVSRYYGQLLGFLPGNIAANIRFVPEFMTSNPIELFRQKRAIAFHNLPAVFKQTYLTFSDYLYALLHVKRVTRLKFRNVFFSGYSIAPLVEEELNQGIGYDSSVRGLLNYRFFYRLGICGKTPKKIIGWFENQALDKGWNLGANSFCPSAMTVGYQAFPDMPGYFCMFPTDSEFEHGVLPKQLAVTGRGWIESRTTFCSKIPTLVAPAFRFEHVWSAQRNMRADPLAVLVTLPIDSRTALQMLRVVREYLMLSDSGIAAKFRIKLHPAGKVKADDVRQLFSDQRNAVQVEVNGFDDAIKSVSLLMSTMSSTCLESIACGVPVAVYVGNGSEWQAIPDDVPKHFSHWVQDSVDLRDAIRKLAITNEDDQVVASIRSQYFERPTVENAIRFID